MENRFKRQGDNYIDTQPQIQCTFCAKFVKNQYDCQKLISQVTLSLVPVFLLLFYFKKIHFLKR